MKNQTNVQLSKYEVPEGVSEYHAIIRVIDSRLTYTEQVEAVFLVSGVRSIFTFIC